MPEGMLDTIRARLAPLAPIAIEISDDSAAHAGHAGAASGGGHFRLRLVSAQFIGRSKVDRHRLVYHQLSDLMRREIHALAMNLLAPDEVQSAPNFGSPDFEHTSGH